MGVPAPVDRNGKPFCVERGEHFAPIRPMHGLKDKAVFRAVAFDLLHAKSVRDQALHLSGLGLTEEQAVQVMEAALCESERMDEATARETLAKRLPAFLRAHTGRALPHLNATTAREKENAARRRQVRKLSPYRRGPKS